MPLLFRGNSPGFISYEGKRVEKVLYNGTLVWKSFPAKKPLEDTSWEDISIICRAGLASEYWQLGDTKCLISGDSSVQLQIIGFDHDPVTDAESYGREKAAMTLQMVQLIPELSAVMNNTNYIDTAWYHSSSMYCSDIRSTLFPSYFQSALPAALQNVIVPVQKEYYTVSDKGENTISDTLFLPSLDEVLGTVTSFFGSEGKQYAFFAQGGSKIKKTADGTASSWWTRSPTGSNARFYLINTSGALTSASAISTYYAPPCLCI